ncbi:hypothetical protein [Nitrosopumilus sp.]|uniref:hypothetical protein n=1 Tax=Nitrosopumilus sp. TaxID=2024843 RepID=UPI00247CF78C|nr:hypothetical protein [Nitrosopumilus sp.]MCV0431552.1 hypothetical protein [Nitrosopumilus sp.]
MQRILLPLILVIMIGISTNYAFSQEMGLATFQETAQIIIDKSISQNVTASITLQSTSLQEIQIPAELEKKIRENKQVTAIIVTNEERCVLGVVNESCIMINVVVDDDDRGIFGLQDNAKKVSESYIDEINQVFDTDAKFHSVFIHNDDISNKALETSGIISGRGTISAVYTMPKEDTSSMYEKISAILIPKTIRDSEGFYEIAKELSNDKNAKMTFSLIPFETKSLFQLKLAADFPGKASTISEINPLEIFNVNSIKRSDYFSGGFYPLNSIIQVVILSDDDINVSNVNGKIIPTQIIDEEKIPIDITDNGWIFDPDAGKRIQGKYIFGKESSIDKNELVFSLAGEKIKTEKPETDESVIVVGIITIVAIAAAIFYLKGYRK